MTELQAKVAHVTISCLQPLISNILVDEILTDEVLKDKILTEFDYFGEHRLCARFYTKDRNEFLMISVTINGSVGIYTTAHIDQFVSLQDPNFEVLVLEAVRRVVSPRYLK